MDLKHCPFCGSNDVELCGGDGCYYVTCNNCCDGAYPETEEEAVNAWNTRYESDKQGEK